MRHIPAWPLLCGIAVAAPALANALLEAYVHQLFGAGVFHADPHPGNLFFFDDGRWYYYDGTY